MEERRGAAHFTVSDNGSLVYLPGGLVKDELSFVWVDMKGNITPFAFDVEPQYSPRISPDGKQLAVGCQAVEGGREEIRIYGTERGTMRRLTDNMGDEYWAVWTPDSSRVIFNSNRDGGLWNLYCRAADCSSPAERLTEMEFDQFPQTISPDGKMLAFGQDLYREANETGTDIWMLPLDGNREPFPFVQTQAYEIHPVFSPDGRWVAYASNESGRLEVYMRPFPGPGGAIQVSTEGGCGPVWSPDGKEIFYRSWSGTKMSVRTFEADPTPQVGEPKVLFERQFLGGNQYGRQYDLSPDGQKFLMIQLAEPPPPPKQLNVILNWFDELNRLVPAGK
jgi:Tol biopolymer transport system component